VPRDSKQTSRGAPLGLYSDVLEPALVDSGREWQAGRISAAHEHYISEVSLDLMRQYGAGPEPTNPVAVAVACCVPRERHTIGLKMVADALRVGGVTVYYLGEGLPDEAIFGLMAEVDARWLGLSCTLDVHLPEMERLIGQARPGVRVIVGGAALRDRGEAFRRRLAADFTAPDLAAVRRLLPEWLREAGTLPGSISV
jgi:methanogenic corrinoid protein MtbC1